MPRTYRFDHYLARSHDVSRAVQSEEKQHLQEGMGGEAGTAGEALHYGRRFAQTGELLAARRLLHEQEHPEEALEEELDDELAPEPYEELPSRADAPLHRGAPIGSLPAAEALPATSLWREVSGLAQLHARSAFTAARELSAASRRLLFLPVETLKLVGRRLRMRVA